MNRDAGLTLGIPSKGRLMEKVGELFAQAGLTIAKTGHERGYRGNLSEMPEVEVAFLSASEIAWNLAQGRIHLGITGEDLIRESIPDAEARVELLKPLGFGHADVVAAVPQCWLDVYTMADLEEVGTLFYREHGRRLRVATKYMNLTRRFFAEHGVTGYRIVQSLGATEGTPAAGAAEMIVDITSTGTTLKANHLRILDDGIILKSEANLAASRVAGWSDEAVRLREAVLEQLAAQKG
ncbi:MAG: ATP phosphoribosyltransferase [Alphaproteobacteria bacterium]|nr:MAG: ATP phosphoribosyltransferase [Alphaproteobacteria bacterium]